MSEEGIEIAESQPAAPAADAANLDARVEAVLLSTDRPVAPARLAEALGLSPKKPRENEQQDDQPDASTGAALIRDSIARLNAHYAQTNRSFRIEPVAGGFRLMTLPEFARVIAAFQGGKARTTLSHAALETLAIISYKQPLTRARLEAIRGVACAEILRSLIDRRLVTVSGRAEEPGRPILYATTKQFLQTFGLASLRDLPTIDELRPSL